MNRPQILRWSLPPDIAPGASLDMRAADWELVTAYVKQVESQIAEIARLREEAERWRKARDTYRDLHRKGHVSTPWGYEALDDALGERRGDTL